LYTNIKPLKLKCQWTVEMSEAMDKWLGLDRMK